MPVSFTSSVQPKPPLERHDFPASTGKTQRAQEITGDDDAIFVDSHGFLPRLFLVTNQMKFHPPLT